MADNTIDARSAVEIEQADQALTTDNALAAADPSKFTAPFRTLGATRLGALKGLIVAINTGLGDQDGAVRRRRLGLDRIEAYARAIYGRTAGFLPDSIPNPGGTLEVISAHDRDRVFGAYGFAGGSLGNFDDARRLALGRQAIAPKPAGWPAFWLAPDGLLSAITQELAVSDALDATAGGGAVGSLYAQRDTARADVANWNGRVRAWVMYGSDAGDQEPKLALYGHSVRREPGSAQVPAPAAPGTATFDAAAKTLTVPALPANANSLRAYVETASGTPRLAGTSTSTTVNLGQLGPIEHGVAYRAWLTGYSADGGEGPAGNVVSFTA